MGWLAGVFREFREPGCGGRQKIEQVLGIHLDRYVLRTLG